jgi:hypothetical protein
MQSKDPPATGGLQESIVLGHGPRPPEAVVDPNAA